MAKVKRRIKLKDLAEEIGVSYTTLSDKRARNKDFPKIGKGNLYDAEDVCRWIITHTTNQSTMSRGAEDYLARLNGGNTSSNEDFVKKSQKVEEKPSKSSKNSEVSNENTSKVEKNGTKPEKSVEIPSQEVVDTIKRDIDAYTSGEDYTGFAQHVQWLGIAMVDTWRRYQNALASEDEAGIQSATRTYNVQLETLRKAEGSRVELETALGKLVLRDVAKQKFTSLCVNIKSKLLPLGAKLCHELCNQRSAKKVKEIIDSEVRDILATLAEQPF